ncbi:MAG TPA: efflux RND transporter periplasmic adaptor subunit, partial [Polyangiaceae bacterium]
MTADARPGRLRRALSSVVFAALLLTAGLVFRRQLADWFSGKSMGGAGGAPVTAHAGPFVIRASFESDPPAQKGNALLLEIRDRAGKATDDAIVEVAYDMAAMGSMAEMKGGAKIEHESGGHYRAEFDLPTAGTWTLKTKISAPGGKASQDFSMTVGAKGLSVVGGTSGGSGASAAVAEPAGSTAVPGEIDHYTCSMHPSVRQKGPGSCPICGMTLVPVTKEQQEQGVVMIDDARRQLIGVRTGAVVLGPMRQSFRAVGQVTYDESQLSDVTLKVQGFITKLFVSQTGQRVARGQPLFTLYSPELYNAQQDFLLTNKGNGAVSSPGSSAGAPRGDLGRAARQRLHLLGLSDGQIASIEKTGAPMESVAIASPASGFVIEKNVVDGASVDPGMRLFRIAALNEVWVEADVFEGDLGHVRVGQSATVTLDYVPGRSYDAKVQYIYPYLDPKNRTGRVRVKLGNKDLDLRPGMYASVELAANAEPRLQVPAAAVVYTGPRRLVFLDLGSGRFKPQEIRVGLEANGMYEVLDGLHEGDVVATSGVFLIAAEARITTAAKYWDDKGGAETEAHPPGDGMQNGAAGGMAPMPAPGSVPPASGPPPMPTQKSPPPARAHTATALAPTPSSPA